MNEHINIYLYLRSSAVCFARVASCFTRTDSAIAALSTSATLRDCSTAPASSSLTSLASDKPDICMCV